MVISYISQLHVKIYTQHEENAKLLDGMHEGLIILSKQLPYRKVLFSNKPIEKFLNNAIAAIKSHIVQENERHWLLSPALFKPV